MSGHGGNLYRKRLWLNPLGAGDAYISASLDEDFLERKGGRPNRRDIWGSVNITDCSRKISLSFQDDRASVEKVDKLLQVLMEFREALVAEVED